MLIINPNAGKGGYKAGIADVMDTLYSAGWLPTVYFTAGPGDGARLAREHAAAYARVVCVGGDGTLSDVVNGLMALPACPPIGYIPMGTANDVASTLGLSHIPESAARTIVTGRPLPLDVGVFGGESFFTYIAAFGAFTEVSYATRQELKQALGQAAYIIEGMKQLPKLPHYSARVEFDGGVIEGDFVFGAATNSRSMGGILKLDSGFVDLCDGRFELVLVRDPKTLADFNSIAQALMTKTFNGPDVMIFHTSRARFIFDGPVPWTRDGESGGSFGDVNVTCRHAGMSIIVD